DPHGEHRHTSRFGCRSAVVTAISITGYADRGSGRTLPGSGETEIPHSGTPEGSPMHPAPPTPDSTSTRRVALATLIGTSIEWYDFFVYGAAAALVFGKLFFPDASPLTGTLLALSTFGVGFIARPVGGVVFAHFGDRIGRKSMLVLSVLLMGGGTFAVGLLPSAETIGAAAPILLVLLRIVQGIGIGGEWGAAAVMAVEHAPPHRRGF